MRNEIARREALDARKHELHEQLSESTRRLQQARAQVRYYEQAMEGTLTELHEVTQEYDQLTTLIEGMWNGPAAQRPARRE